MCVLLKWYGLYGDLEGNCVGSLFYIKLRVESFREVGFKCGDPMSFSVISSKIVVFLFYDLYCYICETMTVEVSVYWALCMSSHVISVVSKSKSKVLASLSYVLFVTYSACDEVDYIRGGASVVSVYRVYYFCCRTLKCSCWFEKRAY